MRRTVLVISSGAILSFLLASGGHWLIYSLVSGTHEAFKDDYIEISMIQILVVLPLASILCAGFVGILLLKRQGLYGGVCLLPLTVYLLYESRGAGAMVLLCLIYIGVGILTALLVSRQRNRKALSQPEHA